MLIIFKLVAPARNTDHGHDVARSMAYHTIAAYPQVICPSKFVTCTILQFNFVKIFCEFVFSFSKICLWQINTSQQGVFMPGTTLGSVNILVGFFHALNILNELNNCYCFLIVILECYADLNYLKCSLFVLLWQWWEPEDWRLSATFGSYDGREIIWRAGCINKEYANVITWLCLQCVWD